MTDKEFEDRWQANREQLLKDDKEYQYAKIGQPYTRWEWVKYAVAAVVGIIVSDYLPLHNEWLKLLATIITIIVLAVVFIWIESLFIHPRSLEDIESDVKARYRQQLMS